MQPFCYLKVIRTIVAIILFYLEKSEQILLPPSHIQNEIFEGLVLNK
jgi:hypothetical protein